MKSNLALLTLFFIFNTAFAQHNTILIPSIDSVLYQDTEHSKEKKVKHRKDEFKVYAGINFNQLNIVNDRYHSNLGIGWDFGFNYKRGKFFYWELGVRYNNPVYVIKDNMIPAGSASIFDGVFSVRHIDVPITGGINFLSITSRIVGIRVFASIVPSFGIGVGSNDLDIVKDDLNSFILFGQVGIGVDVAFLFIETGFNYGFTNLFHTDFQSNPYQLFVNLGFRF
jgi:hypothetical protein